MLSFAGPNPWCIRALVYNESILVMPDLNIQGYFPRPHTETFDLAHALVSTASLARFHAAFANYHTGKNQPNKPYNIMDTLSHIINESTFQESCWLRAAAKLSTNMLGTFSTKSSREIPELEAKIYGQFIEACDSLREYEGTLNVILHKDPWVNNIMFQYDKGLPINALFIDYQCIRYGPPTFDVMGLLYLTTSREFREQHENKILHYYYCVFSDSLDEATRQRVTKLGYDREEFLRWCERCRKFAMCLAIAIFPYILMEPVLAQKTFDDPETFDTLLSEDRSGPVVAHAKQSAVYKDRQVEAAEEFVERFVLNEP